MTLPITGHCDAAFSAVGDAFAGNFAERGEVGGAATVIVEGCVVVELVGGWANADDLRPWQANTLVNFYSVGRPFGPNPNSFGHFGTGGALGFADPTARVAFGYTMNHVIPRWQSARNRALIVAVYESL